MEWTIKFKKLCDDARLPTKKYPTDAGWDLYACEDKLIPAHGQAVVKTGIQLAGINTQKLVLELGAAEPIAVDTMLLHYHLALLVWSRSGLNTKHGLHVGAGVIDEGYRGEMLVLLHNLSNEDYEVKKGDKIAQFIPTLVPETTVTFVDDIEVSDRNAVGGIMEVYN